MSVFRLPEQDDGTGPQDEISDNPSRMYNGFISYGLRTVKDGDSTNNRCSSDSISKSAEPAYHLTLDEVKRHIPFIEDVRMSTGITNSDDIHFVSNSPSDGVLLGVWLVLHPNYRLGQ